MANILQFPKGKSQKIRSLQKAEAKRLFLSLSILSVIAVSVSINERFVAQNRPSYYLAGSPEIKFNSNRQIASVIPQGNVATVEEIKWGHFLIKKMNQKGVRLPAAHVAEEPSALDQVGYGELSGKYKITESEIKYIETNDVADKPIYLKNRVEFLNQYSQVIGKPFRRAVASQAGATKEVYQLFDDKGKDLGQAAFEFDEAGRFRSLKVDSK